MSSPWSLIIVNLSPLISQGWQHIIDHNIWDIKQVEDCRKGSLLNQQNNEEFTTLRNEKLSQKPWQVPVIGHE